MDDVAFDKIAREELEHIEEALMDVDPDDIEISSSDGVLNLELRDGVRIVVNSHRAARQIWMAAVARAWHFDHDPSDGRWRTSSSQPEELRATLQKVVSDRIGVDISL